MNPEKIQDIKETALVFAVFTGLFLPARVIFYSYVSQYWLGSFGVITAIAVIVFILAYKNKLGRFGEIWKRRIIKIAKGKIGAFLFFQAFFSLAVYGGYVYFIETGNTAYNDDVTIMNEYLEQEGITGFEMLENEENLQRGSEAFFNRWLELTKNPHELNMFLNEMSDPDNLHFVLSIAMASADDLLDGWLLHFNIVFFIEQAEQIVLVTYFRYFYKEKNL